MLEQAKNRFQWRSNNMRTYFGTLNNMIGITDRGRQYLCFIALDSVNIYNLFYQLYAVPATIINTTNERRNIFCTGFSSQNRLTGRETQCTVGSNTVIGKPFNGFYTFFY